MPARAEDIDWDAFTQMNSFALRAQRDGGVCCSDEAGRMRPARVGAIVEAAHAHGKPILIAVGGWANYDELRSTRRCVLSTRNLMECSSVTTTLRTPSFRDSRRESVRGVRSETRSAFSAMAHEHWFLRRDAPLRLL